MLSRMAEEGIPPQKIAGTTITSRIEDSAQITFSRRPEPWRDGDVLEIFHEPSGHTTSKLQAARAHRRRVGRGLRRLPGGLIRGI